MEVFLAQCAGILSSDSPLLLSVVVAGLVGSLSHCSVMCSPLVAAQMLSLQEQRKPQSTMLYYHAGRITTYSVLGVLAVTVSSLIFAGTLQGYTQILLVLAGISFIVSAAFPQKTHACCSSKTRGLQSRIEKLSSPSLAYYLRGMLMGLMPCGMIVAVLLSVATLSSPFAATFVMVIFGLTTVPVLQLAGYGALSLGKKYPKISTGAGRSVMALNGLFLCGLGLNIMSMH